MYLYFQVILRSIDSAVKSMGATSEHLLEVIENCPLGAETLAARIVHLLTERSMIPCSFYPYVYQKLELYIISVYRINEDARNIFIKLTYSVLDPPTLDLVNRISALYEQGRTDVRSMIPVLTGLDKVILNHFPRKPGCDINMIKNTK